jgi:NitT/TauT family transport system permease protein
VGKEVLLPSPKATLTALWSMLCKGEFYLHVGKSILRVMLGYFLGIVLGVIFGVLSVYSGFAGMILSPLRSIIKATPVASFIILAYMWLTKPQIPGVIAALIVIPIVWGNISEGLLSVDKKELECAKVFSLGFYKKLKYIYLPHIKPYFVAAALTSTGLAWKSGIAAETLVDLGDSIGGMLYDSKTYLESADLFALTAVVILLSMVIEKLFVGMMAKKGRKNDKV